jgi:8-oxo-dGTP diphosphatase
LEEIKEELGIDKKNVSTIHFGKPYEFAHPVLLELKNKPEIKLDWEHTEYRWIEPKELKKFDIVLKLEESLEKVLK